MLAPRHRPIEIRSEAAGHQVSGLGFCKEQHSATETWIFLHEFRKLSNFIQSRTWTTGNIDRQVQLLWVQWRGLFVHSTNSVIPQELCEGNRFVDIQDARDQSLQERYCIIKRVSSQLILLRYLSLSFGKPHFSADVMDTSFVSR